MKQDGTGTLRRLILTMPPQKGLLEGFSSSLLALAGYVRIHSPETDLRLLDLSVAPDARLRTEILGAAGDRGTPLFVGITTTTASYQAALRTARIFREIRPDCVVVFGGHHAGPQDEVILREHEDLVDFVVRGEGEVALLSLLRDYPDVTDVPGLSHLRGGAVRRNPAAPLLAEADLDCIPALLPDLDVRSAPGKFDHATYVSARGCPLSCSFCAVGNQRLRAKSVDVVLDDLRELVEERGLTRIAIEDNFFAHSPARTLELCAGIERLQKRIPFSWDCQTRVESLKRPDIVQALARAGCSAVYVGVEAFTADELSYLGKTARPDLYLRCLEGSVLPQLLENGIEPYVNLQVGIPGSTAASRNETLRILARLGTQAFVRSRTLTVFPQLHVVYPGTRHHQTMLADGAFGPNGWRIFEDFTAWEAEQEPILTWMGHRFAHGTGGIPIGILDSEWLRRGEFLIDSRAVLVIDQLLEELGRTAGLEVFSYGSYLAAPGGSPPALPRQETRIRRFG